ncbi:hypothetical protein QTP88_011277 [Uroleucon formosanum]
MLGDPQSRGQMLLEYLSPFDIQKRGGYHHILHIGVCDGNKFCISTSFEFSYDISLVARAENRFLLEKELVFCIFGLGEVGVESDLIGTVCQLFVLSLLFTILIG